jgi:hypothetical protein
MKKFSDCSAAMVRGFAPALVLARAVSSSRNLVRQSENAAKVPNPP